MTIYKNATINGELLDIGVDQGIITFIGKIPAPGVDLQGKEVIPGFIDIHTHGCMGMDTMDGDEAVEAMSHWYLRQGVTSFYPTTMSASKTELMRRTATLAQTGGAKALGYHLEGPLLSLDYKGAQNGSAIAFARAEDVYKFQNMGLITVAPECEGAMELIEHLDMPVCLGHTGCDYETAMKAFLWGARCVTHMFNAMPPIHHRAPSLGGAAFMSGAYVQLICDGLHVHPAVVKMLMKLFGKERVILISDSMRATGLPDGEYELGGQTVRVDQGVSRLKDGTIAGSTASMLQCVKKAMEFGISKADAVTMATLTPATMMGLNKGKIEMGYDADFVVMDDDFNPVAACVEGRFTKW